MIKKTRIYTSEFKTEAIKLAIDSNSIGLAAKDLGIPISTLHNWVSKSQLDPDELKISNGLKEPAINIKLLLDKNRELQKRNLLFYRKVVSTPQGQATGRRKEVFLYLGLFGNLIRGPGLKSRTG